MVFYSYSYTRFKKQYKHAGQHKNLYSCSIGCRCNTVDTQNIFSRRIISLTAGDAERKVSTDIYSIISFTSLLSPSLGVWKRNVKMSHDAELEAKSEQFIMTHSERSIYSV